MMFRYTIWCDGLDVADGRLQFLPRIGERITINGRTYEIKMITYHFIDGNFSSTPVAIEVVRV